MSQEIFRRSVRQETRQHVRYRNSRGRGEWVWMLDISPTGCLMIVQSRLTVGECITVQPQGLEEIPSYVRWCKEGRAGLEFARPLHPSVADHLARMIIVEGATGGRSEFGAAPSLGRRLLPKPTISIVRSVA